MAVKSSPDPRRRVRNWGLARFFCSPRPYEATRSPDYPGCSCSRTYLQEEFPSVDLYIQVNLLYFFNAVALVALFLPIGRRQHAKSFRSTLLLGPREPATIHNTMVSTGVTMTDGG